VFSFVHLFSFLRVRVVAREFLFTLSEGSGTIDSYLSFRLMTSFVCRVLFTSFDILVVLSRCSLIYFVGGREEGKRRGGSTPVPQLFIIRHTETVISHHNCMFIFQCECEGGSWVLGDAWLACWRAVWEIALECFGWFFLFLYSKLSLQRLAGLLAGRLASHRQSRTKAKTKAPSAQSGGWMDGWRRKTERGAACLGWCMNKQTGRLSFPSSALLAGEERREEARVRPDSSRLVDTDTTYMRLCE